MACGCHHPSHAERRADLLGVARRARSSADDFLERDDVGVQAGQHIDRSLRDRAAVHAAAAMDVVGDDAKRLTVQWVWMSVQVEVASGFRDRFLASLLERFFEAL